MPSPKKGTPIDYLSFVPDGEPTLDDNAGNNIDLLRSLGIKIAVITHGSPLNRGDVRRDLEKADPVSLKIDAVRKMTWLRTNRPHRSLDPRAIAVKVVSSADDQNLTMAYQIFRENVPRVEYRADYEENEFGSSGNIEEDLLAITPGHPTREEPVRAYLKKAGADWNVVTNLIENGSLKEVEYVVSSFLSYALPPPEPL